MDEFLLLLDVPFPQWNHHAFGEIQVQVGYLTEFVKDLADDWHVLDDVIHNDGDIVRKCPNCAKMIFKNLYIFLNYGK